MNKACLISVAAIAAVSSAALADFRVVGVQPIRWGQSNSSVGFSDGTLEDFEDVSLAPGLQVEWLSPNGNVAPTSTLPALFANATGDPFGTAFSTGAWDGTHSLISGRGNQSHNYSNGANWGDVVLHFDPPVKMVGFSMQQADVEVSLVINGTSIGGMYSMSGLPGGGGRAGYVLIEARGSDSISTLKLDNTGGDGWCIDKLLFSATGAPQVALAGFSPSIWPRPDSQLGFLPGTIAEDFEDASLRPGLTIAWDTAAGQFGPTATLPNLFAPVTDDTFGDAFDASPWDGSHSVINTRDNQSHAYTGTGEWGDIEFRFNPPASSVGFSVEQQESGARLVINGRDVGSFLTMAGLFTSVGRNGYVRVDANCGETISSLRLNNTRATIGGDGFGIDHMLVGTNVCDCIDFNNDSSLFDPQDIDAFLSVYSEGPCVPSTATCNDIDFNNDGSLFDPCDIDAFLLRFSEGPCTLCGV